jgi:hypothetical protein
VGVVGLEPQTQTQTQSKTQKVRSYVPLELDVVEALHKLEWEYKRRYNRRITHSEIIRRLINGCGDKAVEHE